MKIISEIIIVPTYVKYISKKTKVVTGLWQTKKKAMQLLLTKLKSDLTKLLQFSRNLPETIKEGNALGI